MDSIFCNFSVSMIDQTQNFKRLECINSKLLGNQHCETCVRIK